ncbi:uncharacterized protein K444DRAFT_629598 [Hyaloscypha bicolor E]|uniref:NWD NACHT-NTPase N-terminal domain-containing protein n=1 Tax=Hyaloscypha bicolor E TaxID=1095630 RepID=A0A2J6TAY1_9HELO|nr:uncharacterized protein K444DRAFT_629598 [Hyaloscypha bicolor E]PMD60187.1 hypothetical protein K444DRAFT_629598 [Hyaloscypha bicolor E]
MITTSKPASSPQQVTSARSPSPTASSNQPALHGTHTSPTLPEQSRTIAVPSLWDRAYEALRKEDRQLVDNYEKLLSRELEKTMQGIKDFVGTAVAVSLLASLAWAGVCVILLILTNPSAAEQANSDGFTYVTSRMRLYVMLEPLLLPKDQDQNVTIPKDLKA